MKALSKSTLRYAGVLLSAATLLAAQESCTYKKAAEATPTPCNILAVPSYANNVYPILKKNCRDSCHNDVDKGLNKDFSMDHYDQVYTWCTTAPGGSYTTPWLLGNIKHLPGYSAMPVGAAKLSDCDIAVIEAWIQQGAPNN